MLHLLTRYIFRISPKEVRFSRRGFRAKNLNTQNRLEQIGLFFLQGYNAAICDKETEVLTSELNEIEVEFRGFAFEGAAMGLSLLDTLVSWKKRNRLQLFLAGPGSAYSYPVHVGAGLFFARFRQPVDKILERLDPLLGWLVVDGYGFHEGYFHWHRYIESQMSPARLKGYARRVFDQGLGRSLWFVRGADVTEIASTINKFSPHRHADLWSGVGLACAYAGGVDQADIEALRGLAGAHQSCLAQGAAFAAKARQHADNPSSSTELACNVLCGLTASQASHITDVTLENLSVNGSEPAYEVWRKRIQAHFNSICTEKKLNK